MLGLFKKKKAVELLAPLTGKVLDISEVPDEVFSQKMVGDGLAIEPTEGVLVSPVEGTIKQIFPTMHAVGIEAKSGAEILMHIGINTVELKGEGFKKFVETGAKVKPGDKLIEFDLDYIKENATSIITPVLITNMDAVKELSVVADSQVTAGSDAVLKVEMK
ncbi:PTS system IIA component (Glc family) [Orenia metallireducens]|jgi:glucose-specific phosphotransferase system IIA component|uniref:PTS system IIA component, Glc family n=1 Tax=Orenia metallireducens TaxID=1413210 RepID=A0A285F2B0_9FIRM|nr:PTS glucose transporter subunit IIA [Orenia metallireducens]PRX34738.1 PTS system IIA component (Glc family) [Orenia metallireducens]SNY05425.1 PTS system IIA component, Glc family [Orenia metallireducens]